ncbi:hypothetical protein ABI_17340 [Asticcacaulis biprosthecium C19]|uniref:Uncharacterized protein n=1 Tax=Asticcacaulis biprosthecium C19 TaxID=715226 RepID=F4QKB6_9CAUL|nr:hypothetical protein ABI_17340 [Asticcacaulis biprosthecium C19]
MGPVYVNSKVPALWQGRLPARAYARSHAGFEQKKWAGAKNFRPRP